MRGSFYPFYGFASIPVVLDDAVYPNLERQDRKMYSFLQQGYKNKLFQGISNLTISGDLQGLLAAEESPNWKNQFACSQKLSPDTSRP